MSKDISIHRTRFDELGDWYTDNPLMRSLVALAGIIPPVSVLDAAVVARWEQAQKERFKKLLDELNKGRKYLTEELIQQEDFLYAYVSVARASILTRRKDKIRLFARLLTNACQRNRLGSFEFKENLQILDDLSYHELELLLLFKKHEERLSEVIKTRLGDSRDSRKAQWNAFAEEAEKKLSIPRANLRAALSRTARTGLFELVIGFAAEDTLGHGHTTSRFDEFLDWILAEETDSARNDGVP